MSGCGRHCLKERVAFVHDKLPVLVFLEELVGLELLLYVHQLVHLLLVVFFAKFLLGVSDGVVLFPVAPGGILRCMGHATRSRVFLLNEGGEVDLVMITLVRLVLPA